MLDATKISKISNDLTLWYNLFPYALISSKNYVTDRQINPTINIQADSRRSAQTMSQAVNNWSTPLSSTELDCNIT